MRGRRILIAFLGTFILGLTITYHIISELEDAGAARFYKEALSRSHNKDKGVKKHEAKESSQCSTGLSYPWTEGKPMGVLLLRGASFIGYHIAKELLEEGHKVTIMDNFHGNHMADNGALQSKELRLSELRKLGSSDFSVIENDPCDLLVVRKLFKKYVFTHVVYIPGEINPHESAASSMNGSLLCLSRVLERLKLHSYVHLTLLSSLSVHHVDNSVPQLFKTSHTLERHNYQTLLQSSMENVLEFYHFLYKLPITCLRLGTVYGDWMDLSDPLLFLLEKTLHKEAQEKVVDLADGDFSPSVYYANQSILHVSDVVHTVMKVMDRRYYCEYFDVGAKAPSSLEDVHRHLMRESKRLKTPTHAAHQTGKVLEYYGISKPVHRVAHYKPCEHPAHIQAVFPEWSVPLKEGVRRLVRWYERFKEAVHPLGSHDVIFTSYFTSSRDPQRKVHMKGSNFNYMKLWYFSLLENNLQATIFHDGLQGDFISKIASDDIQFHFASLNQRSTNDARFYSYRDYLLENTAIQRVILTDISDVVFLRNPFELMDVLGNLLYIGTDIDYFPNMDSMGWLKKRMPQCFGNASVDHGEVSSVKKYKMVYNAGVIGGSRSLMLEFLNLVTSELDKTPSELNCNMPVVNYVVHKYFDHRVFTGFPWTSKFYQFQSAPQGVYMIHK